MLWPDRLNSLSNLRYNRGDRLKACVTRSRSLVPCVAGTLTLSALPPSAEIVRKTRETDIRLRLDLDGQGRAEVATGIGFLDHMLELFARHSLVDLAVACTGDLHVDGHHTTEDVGICLGQAIDRALGDRAGIRRYGHAVLPMDETLVTAAVDLGGRAYWVWDVAMPAPKIGDVRQRAGRRFLAGGRDPGADEPARDPAPRPQHAPHQRGGLQGGGPRLRDAVRARPPMHRRSLDQGNALSDLDPHPTGHATNRTPQGHVHVMNKPKDIRGSGQLVNAALVVLAFGLLGLVIWRNCGQDPGGLQPAARSASCSRWRRRSTWSASSRTFVRWFFLVRVIEPRFKFSATVLLGFIGMVFNLVIPGAVGGDLIKAAYLVRMRIRKTQAIASMVIDRIVGLLGLFILASIAGAFAWASWLPPTSAS